MCSYFVLVLDIHLTTTDVQIIERAFAIAFDVGRLPDPKIDGDAIRILVLRDTLRKACESHKAHSGAARS